MLNNKRKPGDKRYYIMTMMDAYATQMKAATSVRIKHAYLDCYREANNQLSLLTPKCLQQHGSN